jgi:hypothetical protein
MHNPPSQRATRLTGWARVFAIIEEAAEVADRLGFNKNTPTTAELGGAADAGVERANPEGPTHEKA